VLKDLQISQKFTIFLPIEYKEEFKEILKDAK